MILTQFDGVCEFFIKYKNLSVVLQFLIVEDIDLSYNWPAKKELCYQTEHFSKIPPPC